MFTATLQNAVYSSSAQGCSVAHVLISGGPPTVQLNGLMLVVGIPIGGTTVQVVKALIEASPTISGLFSVAAVPAYYNGEFEYDGSLTYDGSAQILNRAVARTWLGNHGLSADELTISPAVAAISTPPFDGALALPIVMAEALYAQLQELAPVVAAERKVFDIPNQSGVILDQIGSLLGQTRGSLNDATYISWLKARGFINKSKGTFAEISTIFDLLGATKKLSEPAPAALQAVLFGATEAFADQIDSVLNETKAAGISSRVFFTPYTSPQTFTLDGVSGQGLDQGRLVGGPV